MTASLPLVSSLNPFNGLGFMHTMTLGIYVGCPTYIIAPQDVYANPIAWLEVIQASHTLNTYLSETALRLLATQLATRDKKLSINLAKVLNIQLLISLRPDVLTSTAKHAKKLKAVNIQQDALSITYQSMHASCISSRSHMNTDPVELYLKLEALRRGMVELGAKTDFDCIKVTDVGRILPCSFVAIVKPNSD